MHLEHKPGETMQVEWAGQTADLVDTDTGERLDAYLGSGVRTESWTPRKRRRLMYTKEQEEIARNSMSSWDL